MSQRRLPARRFKDARLHIVKNEIYNAAKEGRLQNLKHYLDCRSEEDVEVLVESKTNGATPLIAACRNGHKNVAEYLVDDCRADVELVGSVTFDGETIDGAPPLWCAAAAGYLDIVKLLVKANACINNTTVTNSTPLRAACYDGHFEIVQYLVDRGADIEIANRHGHTCLMISCFKGHHKIVKFLLEKGADVNAKGLKGNTALHDCAESGSLEILKLLLNHTSKFEKDSYGMSPLLAAAVTGHVNIVQYLIGHTHFSRRECVDALELLGATFVDKKRDMIGALTFWKLAMDHRVSDQTHVLEKPTHKSPIAAYENAVEARSMEELDELIRDPNEMRMQSLLVRERILGPAHPETSYYIRYRGAVYADAGDFDRCITLWMYALGMQQDKLDPLCAMTQSSFSSFVELFTFMMAEDRRRKPHPVAFTDMMVVFEKAVNEMESGMVRLASGGDLPCHDANLLHQLLIVILHLISLLCRIGKKMTSSQVHTFRCQAYKMLRLKPVANKNQTLLHLACSRKTTCVGRYPLCTFPDLEVIDLLIEVGAAVNAVDVEGNTPLHIAAMNKPCDTAVVQFLLKKGAHIDARNREGKTSLDYLERSSLRDVVSPLRFQSLQCLAAREIILHGIHFSGQIPKKLEDFVAMH